MLALRLLLLGCGATVAVGQQARAGDTAASLRAAEEERVQIGPGDNYDDDKVPAAVAEDALLPRGARGVSIDRWCAVRAGATRGARLSKDRVALKRGQVEASEPIVA